MTPGAAVILRLLLPDPQSPSIQPPMRDTSGDSIMSIDVDGSSSEKDPQADESTWASRLEAQAENLSKANHGAYTSDRAELMERIKKGESPTWVPSKAVSHGPRRQEQTSIGGICLESSLALSDQDSVEHFPPEHRWSHFKFPSLVFHAIPKPKLTVHASLG